ncbi:MAG TPA: hypothetical protein VGS41_09985, partial [Chthonomonadales bacterium]|nr:hypothetical protein [Chthonomonadales bacterium]
MRTSNTAFRPFAAILLISIPAALCVRALAQAPSPQAPPQSTPSTPSKVDTGSTTSNPPQIEKKQTGIPAPGNPLVLLNPLDRSGNAADRFDSNGNRKPEPFIPQADGGNYRKYRNWDPRAIGKQNPLPIFGMDFFAPARDYIDAERMRLRELAGSQIPITTTGSLRPDAYHSTGSQNQLPTSGSYRNPQGQPSPGASGAGGATGGSLGSLNSGSAAGALGGAALGAATASGIGTGVPDSLAGRGQLNAGRAQTGYSGSVLPEGAPYTGGAFGDLEMNRESQYRSNSGLDSAPLYTQRMPVQPGQYGGELPPYGPYAQFPTGFAYPGYPESYPPGAYPGAPYQTIPNAAQYNSQFQIVDPLMMRSANVSASVPASYRLSAGDMLTIRFWSPVMSSVETSRLIDETGTISLEG